MAKLVVFKDNALVSIVPLEKDALFIGRKSDNDVPLPHTSVSRQHAKVSASKDGHWHITDLDSLNGISINGNKVTKASLSDGDTVTLGDFSLIFHQEQKGAGLALPASLKNSPLLKDEMHVTQAVKARGDFTEIKDAYEALRALFVLVNRFQSLVDYQQLMEQMIDCLLEIFSAERGFILLYTSKTGKLDVAVSRGLPGGEVTNTVSHTIALASAKDRKSILITDAEADQAFRHVESIKRKSIRSILCAPIVKKQRTFGVVYLDSKLSQKVFTSRDLSFLEAFTHHAADAIDRAQDRDKLVREAQALKVIQKSDDKREHDFESIVASAKAMRDVLAQVKDVAVEDTTAILLGESGTGKELLAKAIHYASPRAGKPFVAVNCMALSEDLIESELFGHEKGSFSGALERRVGRFELAEGGTIFLDEIGELSPKVQVKLLRVIQERQIERIGGGKPIDVDVRIVCATNANLDRAVREGRFRQDLYYRIMVFPIRIPPLRERREDVPALAKFYLTRFNAKMSRKHSGFEKAALERLAAYDWPGNVRELVNVIERAFVVEKGDLIGAAALPADLAGPAAADVDLRSAMPRDYDAAVEAFERVFLTAAMKRAAGDLGLASEETGIPRRTLEKKLKELRIQFV
jgi:Nif-specific regulatory protein